MDAKIKCSVCSMEFEDFDTAIAHVEAEHPEVP